jgi:hypothetical protein
MGEWKYVVGSVLAGIGLLLSAGAQRAQACGGLFCDSAQPVNQAAERIVFVENGDGTVTAVIEIQYEGPAERFSWVLPVPGIPRISVSSTAALDRLQSATNPRYVLQTTFEDGCAPPPALGVVPGGGAGTGGFSAPRDDDSGVIVVAAGTVGPFDYEVIMLDPELDAPADVAIEWLMAEGYDVTALAPEVLGPYLANGLNLIAFRLNKQNSAGSIRPIVLSYESDLPFIPIRPTAVAANDDMGVMVWVVARSRAVPDNYKALELNDALINWFNPMSTYDAVVSAAADEAEGQGFVTEIAGRSNMLDDVILQPWEAQEWSRIANQNYGSAAEFLQDASGNFGRWDGFEDAVREAVTLGQDVTLSDFLDCPRCFLDSQRATFDQDAFRLALYEGVYKPVADTQKLLVSRPYVTRLYTTMSAEDMTMDPAFNFNADLDDVSNIHTAQQILGCNGDFRVVLPNGDIVYGEQQNSWPLQIGDQPATRKILQLSSRGPGQVVEDNSNRIASLLEALEGGARPGTDRDGGADGGTLTGGGRKSGCAVGGAAGTRAAADAALVLLALGWLVRRRSPLPRA